MDRKEQEDDILRIMKKWTPKGFEHESPTNRLLRALLNANACVEDLRSIIKGEQPIRTDYPE